MHFLLTCCVFKKKQYTKNKNIIWKQTKTTCRFAPKNAFWELKRGQKNTSHSFLKKSIEVNAWSVSWGIVMAVIFSAAAAFLGLKVGQYSDSGIPIAIIAVGLSGAAKRKNALGENVIIQSIGACSGVIVAGAIFPLPALYILQAKYPELTVNFMEVFAQFTARQYIGYLVSHSVPQIFRSDMHGKYPFPEATRLRLSTYFRKKARGKPLILAGLVGGLLRFLPLDVRLVGAVLTRILPWEQDP